MPTPTSATNSPVSAAQLRRAQRPPAAGRHRRRPVRPAPRPGHAGLGVDVGRMAFEQHPGRGAVPQDRRWAGAAPAAARTGRPRPRTTATRAGRGRHRRRTSPSRPMVPSEPTSRRQRSKPLTFFTVGPARLDERALGRHVARLEQHVADRAVAQAAHAALAHGEHARRPWPPRRRAAPPAGRARPAPRRPRRPSCPRRTARSSPPARTRRSLRGPAPRALPGATAPPTSHCVRPPTDRHRPLGADLVGERGQIHAPSGTRWRSPHREPAGSTFVGFDTPSGSNTSRRRACASRSSAENSSGM